MYIYLHIHIPTYVAISRLFRSWQTVVMFFLFSVPPRHVRDLIILISRWAAGGFWGWKPFKHLLRRKSQPCRQKFTIFSTWLVAFENWQSQVGQRWNFHCPVCLQGRLLFVACKLREYIPKASKSLSTVTARKFEMLRYFDLCLLWSGSGKTDCFSAYCILSATGTTESSVGIKGEGWSATTILNLFFVCAKKRMFLQISITFCGFIR